MNYSRVLITRVLIGLTLTPSLELSWIDGQYYVTLQSIIGRVLIDLTLMPSSAHTMLVRVYFI